ncbi:TlpA family protein disulfide reductase [Clostridium frigoris]|uniref:TlpA family protein disulfide reductase n=1 Tax=Clostridium frigoris TaxID=205327 RepID=A0ABS6BUY9_9CLOT|nr:TlpA disulfide reductase family protein [Clostridium frigoris]MBU3160736.1 TlpA family protein disulfide reductase [Clostridium frigoris]
MKKPSKAFIAIIIVSVTLVGVSIYTVKNYNKTKISVEEKVNGKTTTPKINTKSSNDTNKINPTVIKTKAPNFKLSDFNNKELSLSDLKGKKVFLNFWATWCRPCKEEMPEIQKLYEETKNSDLVIIAIEIGEPLSTVKSFIASNKYSFKVLLDLDQSVSAKYNIASIPTSYFIDVDGNIISKRMGAMNIDQMKSYIKTLDK